MSCNCNVNPSQAANLVYLNKIYYNNSETSCPILYSLTTSQEVFTQQLSVGAQERSSCGCGCGSNGGSGCGCGCNGGSGCGCGCNCGCSMTCSCCDFELSANTVFTVTDSQIFINTFTLSSLADFGPSNVTIDGFPVSGLVPMNGQYVADLSGIMDDITRCACNSARQNRCTCHPNDRCNTVCDNDGHFFLAQVPGPWVLGATIVLEGTVSSNNRTCNFRLCMKTPISSTSSQLVIPGSDNFALYCVDIPCQTAGIAPTLVFDFDACASLMNPELTVTCTGEECYVTLRSTLVLTPELRLQVTKPALFNLDAVEVATACDDIGQCDPCNPQERCCNCQQAEETEAVTQEDHGCGCMNNIRTGAAATSRSTCSSCNNFTVACQCCDTNGYTF